MDGIFVCQTCGTKYSVEEAKKMMMETETTIVVKNTVQVENLLNLANSSFESKNYSQAEKFCNQVIAIDGKNYEAWKLKGKAINYQINPNNQRILEAYNCIMTAYRILDDEQKKEKKQEILFWIKEGLAGEVDFWLKQLETNRPTDIALTKAKNAYIDSYNKMKLALEEMKFDDKYKKEYLLAFSNAFIMRCNKRCVTIWNTTVAYNYYRDYMESGVNPFYRDDLRWVIANTDLYRPTQKIWNTFLDEADNLIELLLFAREQFNVETSYESKKCLFENIIYIEEHVIPSGSWEIREGYTSKYSDVTVGWHEKFFLDDGAIESRRKIISACATDIKIIKIEGISKELEKYKKEHKKEHKRLDEIKKQISDIKTKNAPRIDELTKERDKKLSIEFEVEKQQKLICET